MNAPNIGNLIALESELNGPCDTLEYSKKIAYYERSKYQCVQKFVDENACWDKSKFEGRAKKMAYRIFHEFLRKEVNI